jgi:hypothetical protein
MKNLLKIFLLLVATAVPLASFASAIPAAEIVINDSNSVYTNSDVIVPTGQVVNDLFIGGAPIYGGEGWGALNIYITDPGTGDIIGHLFNGTGAEANCSGTSGSDCIFYSSNAVDDSSIGTACTLGSNYCIQATGALENVTALVSAQNSGDGIFDNGTIEIEVSAVPEPAPMALLGLGLLALLIARRKQTH